MAAPTFSCCDLALRNFPGAADLAADLLLLIELICKKMQLPLIVINTIVAFVNTTTTIITYYLKFNITSSTIMTP